MNKRDTLQLQKMGTFKEIVFLSFLNLYLSPSPGRKCIPSTLKLAGVQSYWGKMKRRSGQRLKAFEKPAAMSTKLAAYQKG